MGIFSSIYGLLVMVIGFGALIFFHELGHFLAAKWAGIRTQAFAVGMGPVICSWRKGIGFRPGSTKRACDAAVRECIGSDAFLRPPGQTVEQAFRALSEAEYYRITDRLDIGETEYSLRWVPIGGFVKMLGQEDLKPGAVSEDSRSYNTCPIGKRMIVVSAGVIMNVLLAIVLFVWAFMVGVRFEAPVVGEVVDTMPAGTTRADNADQLGIRAVGLQSGDVVTHIDGKEARTFADLHIAAAMSKPGESITLTVDRSGVPEPLRFTMTPRQDRNTGLLSIGAVSGSSATLIEEDAPELQVAEALQETGLSQAGVELGMTVVSAAGRPISTFQQLNELAAERDGQPVPATWQAVDAEGRPTGPAIEARVPVAPDYQDLPYPQPLPEGGRLFESGLSGLMPPAKIKSLGEDSPNVGILRPGDVVLRLGSRDGIRFGELAREVRRHAGETLAITVLRGGEVTSVEAIVNRRGMLGVILAYAWDTPIIARPLPRIAVPREEGEGMEVVPTPIAPLNLMPRTRIAAVNDTPVEDWPSFRAALRRHTVEAVSEGGGAEVELTVVHPTLGAERETLTLALSADDVADLHGLAWHSRLPAYAFQPVYTILSAGGDPLTAAVMGFRETHKLIVMTYLTIDRLFRGSVGVEQLRGPVGIVELGTKILPNGFMYFIFFLGMISVNLAVINFLPLPIVDGGLFLFLVYEKLRGRPPSLQFQNAATIVGICLIGGLLVVTFYNDIVRILS
ncbi:MAG: site-2 protease family protein [Planctomycetota bacterium]|nr:site-2 protease family protein [Planctomycetota bacterium]